MFVDFDVIKNMNGDKKLRLMGFDVGDRRVGMSMSDTTWTIASPVGVVDRKQGHVADRLNTFFDLSRNATVQQTIGALIVGYPLLLNGDEGPQCKKVRSFCEKYLFIYQIPILLWDERLSTHGAYRVLNASSLSKTKCKQHVDIVAAVFILQGLLDFFQSCK